MPYFGVISSLFFSVMFYEYSQSSKSCTFKMIGYFEFKSSCSYFQRYLPSGCISRQHDDQSSNQPMIQCTISQSVVRSLVRLVSQSVKQSAYLSVCVFDGKTSFTFHYYLYIKCATAKRKFRGVLMKRLKLKTIHLAKTT